VDARGTSGATTEFLVDTGTSCAFLTSRANAAAGASASARRMRLVANEGATSFAGREATIPALDLGGLSARNLPVFLTDQPHDLRAPANVLGMAWLSRLALSHEAAGDAWTLVQSGAVRRDGTTIALDAPAFPVVPVVNDAGQRVFAMIDTGTPNSRYDRQHQPGRYRVLGPGGATLLTIEARDPAPWVSLSPRGRDIVVWIGLDALEKASFTLDFAAGTWTFGR